MAELITKAQIKSRTTKSVHRFNPRVDLTPMVDLGFLLITFFVFSSAMNEAKAMDIYSPTEGQPKFIAESGAITLIVGDRDRIYYYFGLLAQSRQVPALKFTNFKNIRHLITQKKKSTDIKKLMFLIKSEDVSTFGDNINLLDEMKICGVPAGHYAEAELEDYEKESLALSR